MNWLQIRFTTTPHMQEQLEPLLMDSGALSITLQDAAEQPILEPELNQTPVWDQVILTALFTADTHTKPLLEDIESLLGEPLPQHKVDILEDKDWVKAWMENFKPIQFGKRLWICPGWSDPVDPSAVNLMLDPGLAFGTGTHPTTAMCLSQLDKFPLSGETVIDFGCGSGILAIASILLGAKNAIAVDIDPQAITATKNNARKNAIKDNQLQTFLTKNMPATEAGLVVANILANPLMLLCDELTKLTKKDGFILLSGILAEQHERVINHYSAFTFIDISIDNEWACLLGKKH